MANQKMIKDNFWNDEVILDLEKDEKLLFIYLLTNSENNLIGLYKLSIKEMSFMTSISQEDIQKILVKFAKIGKIYYFDGWVFIKKYILHQKINNPNIKLGIDRLVSELPREVLEKAMEYGFSDILESTLDGVEHHSTMSNYDGKLNLTKLNSTKESSAEILKLWNSKKITVHKKLGEKAERLIANLLKEFSLEEIKKGINVYADVLNSKETFWTYKWTLEEFLQRHNGFRVFVYKTLDDYKEKTKAKGNNEEPEYI